MAALACARQPDAPALMGLANNVRRHMLDATDGADIAALAASLRGEPINLVLATAGIAGGHRHDRRQDHRGWQ